MAKPQKKPEQKISSQKKTDKLFPLVIFVFAFLLYSNTLHHGFVMDDGAVITTHETVQKGFAGIKELFAQSSVYGSTKENFGTYRPLTMSLFAIEWSFFKDNSSGYHFVQVLLYAFLCVVIFIFLRKLLKEYHPMLPFISVLLFAAHPVHTEVAANIKSADEILSLLFCMLASLFTIRFAEASRIKFAFLSWFFFLCALFSKESAATFLLVIQLAMFFFTPITIWAASRKQVITIFSLHLFALLIYFVARNSAIDTSPEGIPLINNALAGAATFSERYATVFVILFNYLKLLFFPHPLCWDYGYNQIPIVGFGNPIAIISVLIYLASGIYAVVIILKKIKSPSPPLQGGITALISFCILFYLIGLSVSSNFFFLIGSTMAERFLFTPSLAFCILIGFLFYPNPKGSIVIRSFALSRRSYFGAGRDIILFIVLSLFSFKTFTRNEDWKSNLTLFAKGVETCPNSYRTNTTFAWESVLAAEKESEKEKKKVHLQNAVVYYQKGLSIYDRVEADWYNLGVSFSNLGKADEAVKAYQGALAINRYHRNSNYNLAAIYLSRKDNANSLRHFLRVYEKDSLFMDVCFKIGLNYQLMNETGKAISFYEKHLRKDPTDKNAVTNLSIARRSARK